MQTLRPIEVSEICNELGETYPKNIEQVHGGDIHSAWKIEFSSKKYFLNFELNSTSNLEDSGGPRYFLHRDMKCGMIFRSHEAELPVLNRRKGSQP